MYILHIQEIGNLNLYLFAISLVSIPFYFTSKNLIYLIITSILFAFSIVGIIDHLIFLDLSIRGFIYLLVVGVFLNLIYLRTRTKNYLLFGNILLALSFNSLLRQILEIRGLIFFLIGASFYISYLNTYRNHRIVWPKYLSLLFFMIGFLIALYFGKIYQIIAILLLCIIFIGIGKLYGRIYRR